jgi:hypothetical protein
MRHFSSKIAKTCRASNKVLADLPLQKIVISKEQELRVETPEAQKEKSIIAIDWKKGMLQ